MVVVVSKARRHIVLSRDELIRVCACGEYDQGHGLAAETEFNWMKLIHLPAETDPRGTEGEDEGVVVGVLEGGINFN